MTQPDASGDPLGASRVTLIGSVLAIPEGELAEARRLYLERYANSKYSIDDVLLPTPPTPCDTPVLLIRTTGGNNPWFAAGIER